MGHIYKIMWLVAMIYCLFQDLSHYVVHLKHACTRSVAYKNRKVAKCVDNYDVTNGVKDSQMQNILIFSPTNNGSGVLRELR